MFANRRPFVAEIAAAGWMTLVSCAVFAQAPDQPASSPAPSDQSPPATTPASPQAAAPADEGAPSPDPTTPPRKIFTVPAGTKVLLTLRSAINTKSAKAGDGVYLASAFPVVVGTRVMIPAGVYVQGVVDRVERAGHVKGRAQLDMHFTSIIFPNGTVVEIPGLVDSLPGARKQQVKNDGEGTIQQDGDKTRNMGKVAEVSVPTGGTVGSIGGLGSGHPLAGGIAGIGAGLATAGLVSLFTRGADVNIEPGTQIEMVLQRPLLLEEENFRRTTPDGSMVPLVPADQQPRPMDKPRHPRMMCPPGSLGCE
jgi:hypothetical protein